MFIVSTLKVLEHVCHDDVYYDEVLLYQELYQLMEFVDYYYYLIWIVQSNYIIDDDMVERRKKTSRTYKSQFC